MTARSDQWFNHFESQSMSACYPKKVDALAKLELQLKAANLIEWASSPHKLESRMRS